MQNLQVVEIKGQRVLTTRQIADAYGVPKDKIIYNFNYNKSRYTFGKHYIEVSGEELRSLKRTCEIQSSFKYAKCVYLWTEKGALLHAKSLNTDKAWEVYDWLVDFYFRAREGAPQASVRQRSTALDVPGSQETQEKIKRVNDLCTSVQCVMEMYNRYIEPEEVLGLRKTLYALGAGICSEIYAMGRIKLEPKV